MLLGSKIWTHPYRGNASTQNEHRRHKRGPQRPPTQHRPEAWAERGPRGLPAPDASSAPVRHNNPRREHCPSQRYHSRRCSNQLSFVYSTRRRHHERADAVHVGVSVPTNIRRVFGVTIACKDTSTWTWFVDWRGHPPKRYHGGNGDLSR